jgi:hypothetical protein
MIFRSMRAGRRGNHLLMAAFSVSAACHRLRISTARNHIGLSSVADLTYEGCRPCGRKGTHPLNPHADGARLRLYIVAAWRAASVRIDDPDSGTAQLANDAPRQSKQSVDLLFSFVRANTFPTDMVRWSVISLIYRERYVVTTKSLAADKHQKCLEAGSDNENRLTLGLTVLPGCL